jgi:signal transduction histidine kinase
VLGMKERALFFGGSVTVEGTEGVGTTVKVHMPLPPPEGAS